MMYGYDENKKKMKTKDVNEMISISTKCLLSDPDIFVCICYIPLLFEFNKILFTPTNVRIFVCCSNIRIRFLNSNIRIF